MEVFYIVVFSILGIILVLSLLSFLLPKTAHLERTVIILNTPEEIFPYIYNLKKWVKWSPWTAEDPNLEETFSGPEEGEGATYEWKGNHQVGKGKIIVKEVKDKDYIKWSLIFGPQETEALSYFELRKNEQSTTVTWGFTAELGQNPTSKYMGWIMKSYISEDFERGLLRLKKLMDQQKDHSVRL